MRAPRRREQRGSTMLEFVLVGIPLIFALISLIQISYGMWIYHMLAYAVREGARYATVHGKGCASPQTCQVTIGQITSVIQNAGVGLLPTAVTVAYTPEGGSTTSGTMQSLLSNPTIWPPSGANAPGQNITISLTYPYHTVLAMFWPGAGRPIGDYQAVNLQAVTTQMMQF